MSNEIDLDVTDNPNWDLEIPLVMGAVERGALAHRIRAWGAQQFAAGKAAALAELHPHWEAEKQRADRLQAQANEAAFDKLLSNEPHPDDIAADKFAAAMKAKMAVSRAKGRGGWDDPEECDVEDLACMLVQHVEKGDPVDIGNFCMMIWNRVRDTGPDTYAPIVEALEAYTAPLRAAIATSQQAQANEAAFDKLLSDGPRPGFILKATIGTARINPRGDEATVLGRQEIDVPPKCSHIYEFDGHQGFKTVWRCSKCGTERKR